jgi:hypothetical protein
MIYGESALTHHLFEVALRECVAAVPADTKENDIGLEVAPLERVLMLLQEYDSRSMMA